MDSAVQKVLTGLFLLGFITACAIPKDLPVRNISEAETDTGIAFTYELQGNESVVLEEGCLLHLSEEWSGETYSAQIKPGVHTVFLDLPGGTYQMTFLHCRQNSRYAIGTLKLQKWRVIVGKVSVTSLIKFMVRDESVVRVAYPEGLSLSDEVRRGLDRAPKFLRTHFVSAYDGKAVPIKK